jgi:hypothetical protein
LFSLGFELDERIEERLHELKATSTPRASLPLLSVMDHSWQRPQFEAWLAAHGEIASTPAPVGRRLKGEVPASLKELVSKLVAALLPLGPEYPLPHFRRDM